MINDDQGMTVRRRWAVVLDGRERVVSVVYAKVSGFLSIEVDGERVARGWREWQTVVGGATLEATIGDHLFAARVTQVFGSQAYQVELRQDGQRLLGSDDLGPPSQVLRRSVRAFLVVMLIIAVVTVMGVLIRPR